MAAYAALLSLARTTDLHTIPDEFIFSTDAKENIKSIHEYVASLLWFLNDYPKISKRLEAKIRDVAHKIEDIIEHFILQRIEPRAVSSHVKFEEQLENATEEIGLIAGEVTEERPAAAISSSSSRFAPTTATDVVVGLDNDLMKIVTRLCEELSNLKVIPILGMGGIGKTTLARTVYHHPLIIQCFEIRVWVTVSQDYSPPTFWRTLLGLVDSMKLFQEQMCGDEIDESRIAFEVFKILKYRRYLIVMDDVWGTQVCDDVRNLFPDDYNGSRIIITTRELDVAIYPDPNSPLHEMRIMNDSQSWDLLERKVFTSSSCPPDLEDIGKEIAGKCSGLPLAVVLVAGILSQVDQARASWLKIAQTVNPVVDPEIEEILSLSYTNLPHHLRPCFLFIGGFLSDANIHASRLIKLWVAEGFLKHQNECGETLEEQGEKHLEDLAKRNLVIVNTRKSNGIIRRCSLHDMVRGFCIQKAREEKFLHVMDGPQGLMNERRICLTRSDVDAILCPTVRTILCFQNHNLPSWLESLVTMGRLVRILDALGAHLKELPSEVFELYQLRYISVMGSFNIPSAISNLVNLQTLIIHQAYGKMLTKYKKVASHFLPLEIWRMPQLRHLIFYAPYRLHNPPDGLSPSLENLQTLSVVMDVVWNENIIKMIPNVKILGLVYETSQEFNLHHLKDLHQLKKLKVTGYHNFSWRVQNPTFSCALKKLTLMGGGFPWEKMHIIGSLPNLQVLKLLDNACDGEIWETADGEFPQLRFLLIHKSDLRQWMTESSHFPTLKCLVLRSCEHLAEIQDDIGEIPTLELIEVDQYCGMSLMESAKKIKEDQASFGNDALQVHVIHSNEEIQSSNLELEKQLITVPQEIGFITREMLDMPPAYLPVVKSTSSRLAPTGKDSVISIHDDLKAIIDQLCGLSSNLHVIPILGVDGIGKTTLSSAVYDDPVILKHFQIRSWVTVSQDCSPHETLVRLIHSVEFLQEQGPNTCCYKKLMGVNYFVVEKEVHEYIERKIRGEKIDKFVMAEKLYYKLKGRRYLIVMDDVCSTKVWDDIKNIFPDDGNGSRILLTTRKSYVATIPDHNSPVHEMRIMNDSQSWDLLKGKVFRNNDCPPELENIGKEIAQRCNRLPLAIVLVAGVLSAVDKNQASLVEISKDVTSELEEILCLSYTHLHDHLKPCFLFIGGFPKDANIRASTLINLWVAEGFLNHQNGCSRSLEDVAEEYLEDLVHRNLVIVNSRKSNGKTKSLSLHDVVRSFCLRKAEEEQFLDVTPQAISFNDTAADNICGPNTRTILCFQPHDFRVWLIFSRLYRFIRTLNGKHEDFLSGVVELSNLRYLALKCDCDIPSSISTLANLQTLTMHPPVRQWVWNKISAPFSLPLEIWRMTQLRHLVFHAPCMLPDVPDGSSVPLSHLQTLSLVEDLVWNKKILEMIPKVKKLGLLYTRFEDYHLHCMKHLLQLEKLKVIVIRSFSWKMQSPTFPSTLKKLTLKGGGFSWGKMDIIGRLPNLQVLKLQDQRYSASGNTWITTDEEFPQLKFLIISESDIMQWKTRSRHFPVLEWFVLPSWYNLRDIPTRETQRCHFPMLECLVLRGCYDLRKIPRGIRNIQTLELIEVGHCTQSLEESAKQIKKYRESCGNHALQLRLCSNLQP